MTSNRHVAIWICQIVAHAKKYVEADDRMQGRPSPHVT